MTTTVYASISSPGGVISSRHATAGGMSNCNPDSQGTASLSHGISRGEAVVIGSTASASVSGTANGNGPVLVAVFNPDNTVGEIRAINPTTGGSFSFAMSAGQVAQISELHRY